MVLGACVTVTGTGACVVVTVTCAGVEAMVDVTIATVSAEEAEAARSGELAHPARSSAARAAEMIAAVMRVLLTLIFILRSNSFWNLQFEIPFNAGWSVSGHNQDSEQLSSELTELRDAMRRANKATASRMMPGRNTVITKIRDTVA